MTALGKVFDGYYILRSGGAPGADIAFEKDVKNKNIFLPWRGFNDNSSTLFNIHPKAFEIAEKTLPHWQYLKDPVRKLMARNVHQVLGIGLDTPSEFLICWTQDGATCEENVTKHTGGTGMAIRIASQNKIPVYNLCNRETLDAITQQYNLKEIL